MVLNDELKSLPFPLPSVYYLTLFLPLCFDTFAFTNCIRDTVFLCETGSVKIIIKFRKVSIR
jgi:hypothetical protein